MTDDQQWQAEMEKEDKILCRKLLHGVMMLAHKKYIRKEAQRGVTWYKKMNTQEVYLRLIDHFNQLTEMYNNPKTLEFELLQQCLDVDNYIKMLSVKIRNQGFQGRPSNAD